MEYKVWVDRNPAPNKDYIELNDASFTRRFIHILERMRETGDSADSIVLLDIGCYMADGKESAAQNEELLYWLEETNHTYPVQLHGDNVEAIERLQRIIERNGWVPGGTTGKQ